MAQKEQDFDDLKKKLEANEQESKQIVVVQTQDDSEKEAMLKHIEELNR